MFTNYFKTALRNLWKRKSFSLLNIVGLSVGVTIAALIFLWVEDELTYNEAIKDLDQVNMVMTNQTYSGETFTFASTPGPLASTLKAEIPGVQLAARSTWGDRSLFSKGEKSVYGFGFYVDTPFTSIMGMEFISGDPKRPFNQLHSLVVSEKFARKMFDAVQVTGQTLKMDNDQEYVIAGVFKDFPPNSRYFTMEWLVPFDVFLKRNDWLQYWGNNGVQTYVKLEKGTDVAALNKKLVNFITRRGEGLIAQPVLLKGTDWRLRGEFKDGKQSGGRIRFVKLFSLIAWIIIVLACINFMNLSTARSEQRAREVGVRKVMGSGKGMLIAQFLTEALLLAFIAVIVAIGLIALVLPAFNQMVEKQVALNLFAPMHIGALVAIALICGLVAGSYPAFYLSSFQPVTVLKGLKLPSSWGTGFMRRVLVVAQFGISIGLIICTLIIYQQVMHTRNRDLGFNKNNLLEVSQQLISSNEQTDMGLRFASVKQELLGTGVVENAALSNSNSFQIGSNSSDFSWQGKEEGKEILISMDWSTPGFIGTRGMQLLAGRDFYPEGQADSNNVIINETMARLINKTNPEKALNQFIDRDGGKLEVIGIVKNYLYNNIYGSAAPAILFNDSKAQITQTISIRLKAGTDYKSALQKLEAVFKKYNPTYPFEYRFTDEIFDNLFKGENLIGRLAGVFAGLAIFISCLGLFGLAAFTAERRIREIGIRKVLGASVIRLTSLLSGNFLKLVFISSLIAIPVAAWLMNGWLNDYEYRIKMQWWMFAVPAVLALVVALFTVSFQAIRAALMNPVKSLRSE